MPDRMIKRFDKQAEILESGMKALQADKTDRRRTLWIVAGFALGGLVAALIVTALGWGILQSIDGQKTLSERNDCARALSTSQNETVRRLEVLTALGLADFAQDRTDDLAARSTTLRETAEQVEHLRPLQELVDKRCPSP